MLNLTQQRRQLDALLSEYNQTRKAVKEAKAALSTSREHLADVLEGQKLLQQIAEKVQQHAHRQLASVVTKSLQNVFGEEDAYEFLIQFAQKRGKTEAALCFAKDGEVYDNPRREVGGGCIDVAALALRLASLILTKPTPRKLLVLDEPLKNINGAENRRRLAQLLVTLAKEMQVQIVLSTGLDWLKVGKVVDLSEI